MTSTRAILILVAFAAAMPCTSYAQNSEDLSKQLAQTMILQSQTTNAEYRQRIAAASGQSGAAATIVPLPGNEDSHPSADVLWQGGQPTIQVTMPDGRIVFAKPGAVVFGEWRAELRHGGAVLTHVRPEGHRGH
ncbi:hypothetical protein [Dyella ginsengisoli]|uniref:hypothetical protein n=1 Tax=Dyella ginsengisoli TaxID=363848 RepID=UPI000347FC7C|nr:hypothetical protein [Dyella ginsengisoli]